VTQSALDDHGFYAPGSWTSDQLGAYAQEIGGPDRPIDVGIVRAVKILDDAGVSTFESCEGGAGHAIPEPTVRFHGEGPEGWRALNLCLVYDLPVKAIRRYWDVTPSGEPNGPYWEIVFRHQLN
jgi:hypothetical protein